MSLYELSVGIRVHDEARLLATARRYLRTLGSDYTEEDAAAIVSNPGEALVMLCATTIAPLDAGYEILDESCEPDAHTYVARGR